MKKTAIMIMAMCGLMPAPLIATSWKCYSGSCRQTNKRDYSIHTINKKTVKIMAYTETTRESYGSRLSKSFKGIGSGFIALIIGTGLLFWNEGRTVKTSDSIKDAQKTTVHIDNITTLNADNNGMLVHAVGRAETDNILIDDLFGVSAKTIHLIRTVEYYQWKEHSHSTTREKVGGSTETVTTYTYEREWTSKPVNSQEFRDPEYKGVNFVLAQIESKTLTAENVSFGAYRLPDFLVNSISGAKPTDVTINETRKQQWAERLYKAACNNSPLNTKFAPGDFIHTRNNTIYLGVDENSPAVGDIRITFTDVPPTDVSIIAKVNNNTFDEYSASNGQTFSRLETGTVSMENMFANAHSDNTMMAWLLRLLGVVLVIAGFRLIFGILPMLFKWLPALGSVVGTGVGLITFIFGTAWSLIVIAVAWLFYRPLLAIGLIAAAVAGIVFLRKKIKQSKQNKNV